LGGALVAAVDDLKTLLHSVRSWSSADDDRANARTAELSRFAPRRVSTPGEPSSAARAAAPPPAFLASEAANIAAGLELLTTRSGDAETATNVLNRVRAVRGVAGVKEVAPLAEVLEATEDAARGLESGKEHMSAEARQLLDAAATYLRTLSLALRGASDVNAASPERDAFFAAQDTWANHAGERERVVPIAELFYEDGKPGVVEPSQNPPTSASERFRLELVSLGEHLRQVVDAARRVGDAASVNRARRDLRGALRALQAAAASFGEREIAEFVASHASAVDDLDFHGLAALDDLSSLLADAGGRGERLRARLREVATGQAIATAGRSDGATGSAAYAARRDDASVRGCGIVVGPTPVDEWIGGGADRLKHRRARDARIESVQRADSYPRGHSRSNRGSALSRTRGPRSRRRDP
jgi:hypothetical protein